jgi:hypothetical protein
MYICYKFLKSCMFHMHFLFESIEQNSINFSDPCQWPIYNQIKMFAHQIARKIGSWICMENIWEAWEKYIHKGKRIAIASQRLNPKLVLLSLWKVWRVNTNLQKWPKSQFFFFSSSWWDHVILEGTFSTTVQQALWLDVGLNYGDED